MNAGSDATPKSSIQDEKKLMESVFMATGNIKSQIQTLKAAQKRSLHVFSAIVSSLVTMKQKLLKKTVQSLKTRQNLES